MFEIKQGKLLHFVLGYFAEHKMKILKGILYIYIYIYIICTWYSDYDVLKLKTWLKNNQISIKIYWHRDLEYIGEKKIYLTLNK